MTNQESIERLSKIRFCGPDSLDETIRRDKDQEAIEVAIQVLKTQEPVMPKRKIGGRGRRYTCGHCGEDISTRVDYCPICGRRVNWDA